VPDFSHLRKYAVTEETTAEYVFSRLQGDPSVVLAPAHDCNPAYLRERLAANIKMAERLGSTKAGQVTADDMIRNNNEERDTDRRILAFSCARSWGTAPKDSKGKDVEFTPENCHEFFCALPDEMFDPVRNFAANLFNFFPERKPGFDEGDGAALGN
jgi:hypothetical protein